MLGVLAQESGPIQAVFGSFEDTFLWVTLGVSLVALVSQVRNERPQRAPSLVPAALLFTTTCHVHNMLTFELPAAAIISGVILGSTSQTAVTH